jgi:hypothetical protein
MKFIGDFKDLKPMGFTFHKLYARNYKVYEKHELWIWVAERQIQYRHFNGPTFEKIINMILTDTYPIYTETVYVMNRVFFEVGEPRLCIIDKETWEITGHDEFLIKWTKEFPVLEDYMKFVHGSKRFEELILHKRHFALIKELNERNMLCQENN